MDILRSHNITLADIADTQGVQTWVRWYPCQPGAKAFPGLTAFQHPVWDSRADPRTTGPGLYEEPAIWRGKTFPAPDGQHFHGELEWFATGVPAEVLAALPGPSAEWCGRTSRQGTGGVAVGGGAMPAVIACRLISTYRTLTTEGTEELVGGWLSNQQTTPDSEVYDCFDRTGFLSADLPDQVTLPASGYYTVGLELAFVNGLHQNDRLTVRLRVNRELSDPAYEQVIALDGEPSGAPTLHQTAERTLIRWFDAGDVLTVGAIVNSITPPVGVQFQAAVWCLLLGTASVPGPGASGTFGTPGQVIETITVVNGAVTAVDSEPISGAEVVSGLDSLGGITTSQ